MITTMMKTVLGKATSQHITTICKTSQRKNRKSWPVLSMMPSRPDQHKTPSWIKTKAWIIQSRTAPKRLKESFSRQIKSYTRQVCIKILRSSSSSAQFTWRTEPLIISLSKSHSQLAISNLPLLTFRWTNWWVFPTVEPDRESDVANPLLLHRT